MPRKAAAMDMGRSESYYSRLLNTEEMSCIPDLVDLRRHMVATGSREPLRVLAKWVGDAPEDEDPNPFRLLAECEEASSAFNALLSKLLADGELSKADAIQLLPAAAAEVHQAQKALDALRKRAGRK